SGIREPSMPPLIIRPPIFCDFLRKSFRSICLFSQLSVSFLFFSDFFFGSSLLSMLPCLFIYLGSCCLFILRHFSAFNFFQLGVPLWYHQYWSWTGVSGWPFPKIHHLTE